MSIAVVAGLGNPGPKYRDTRHNLGFAVIDAFGARHRARWKSKSRFEAEIAEIEFAGSPLTLVKPATFVNGSGRALAALLRYRKLDAAALAVVYDDLTLDPGRVKLSLRGGAGGHNGVADIIAALGSGFSRFRVGIGGKSHPEMDLADYVLGRHSPEVAALLEQRMPAILDQLEQVLRDGPEAAMNSINQRPSTSDDCNKDP